MRLSAGGDDAPPALRDLLTEARSDLPPPAVLERMAARLPAPLPQVAPTSAGGAPAAAKLAGALAVVGALVGGGIWLVTREPAPVTSAPLPTAPAATTVEKPPVLPAPSSTSRTEVAPNETESADGPAAPATAKPSAGPSEAALLQRAQAALRTDPGRALALTQEHRRRFPRGELGQEREVIAIEALSRLGRSGEATKRAESFEKAYPGSAHKKKVETSVNPPKP